MKIPGLTSSMIEGYAAEGSFDRGREYLDTGAVISVRRTAPGHLEARVKGSHYVPYSVDVRHDQHGISEVECTCPYFAGGWCKHIVAALLAYLEGDVDRDDPERLSAVVADLDRDQLVTMLESIAVEHPEVISWMLAHVKSDPQD